MSDKVVYNRKNQTSQDIVRLYKQGIIVLCPVCKSELIFITSLEEAKGKAPGHPGIFCPTSPDHVYTTFNMNGSDYWQKFAQRMEVMKEKEVAEMRQKGCSEAEIKTFVDKNYPPLRGNYS